MTHLLEQEEVDAHSGIEQQGRQEDVEEQLVGLDGQPDGDAVAEAPQVGREHDALDDAPCTAPLSLHLLVFSTCSLLVACGM